MSSPQVRRRSQLLVHRGVQGWLMLRILAYLACAAFFVTAVLVLWQLAARGPARWNHNHLRDIWRQYAPVFVAVGILVPLFVYDMLRFSHRFMGPLFRLHRAMEALGRGEAVQPIRFREGDLLHEMADSFNQVLRRMQELESGRAAGSPAAEQAGPDEERPESGSFPDSPPVGAETASPQQPVAS